MVSPDGGAIDEAHAQREVVLLDQIEQALPSALLCPADEQLRGQPPRAKLSRNAAPFGRRDFCVQSGEPFRMCASEAAR